MTATPALERLVRRGVARATADRCGLCSQEIGEQHPHVLDESKDALLCACQACSLLFARDAAGGGHYRLVPTRRQRLEGVDRASLGIPVGLAFFVKDGDGTVTARYPSPAGATECEIDAAMWRAVEAARPELRDLQPRVEAFLVHTGRGQEQFWIVPIDDCYRLVAVVRQEWKGLSGGSRVFPAIEKFFAELGRSDGAHQGR